MKGGKAGRKRNAAASNRGKPATRAQAKTVEKKREAAGAPKKGSRKNTRFGGSSSSGDD
ncbi:MAG: hypothetical protein ABIO52_05715 [Gemmatimonadaceae bacterium]